MKIKINSLSKLSFQKITDKKILFSYGEDKYALKVNSHDCILLYKREKLHNGNHEEIVISSSTVYSTVTDFLLDISNSDSNTLVYSNVDREYFLKRMISAGLAESELFDKEYEDLKNKEDTIQNQIDNLRNQIDTYWEKWFMHSDKCGSKTAKKLDEKYLKK